MPKGGVCGVGGGGGRVGCCQGHLLLPLLLLLACLLFSPLGAHAAPPQHPKRRRQTTMAVPNHSNNNNNNKAGTPTPSQRSFHTSIVAGVSSGIVSSVLCAPLDLLRTRLQVWGELQSTKPQYIFGMLGDIFKKEGLTGCFRGLSATLLTIPTFWGVYFPLYEEFKHRWSHSNLPDAVTHMSAAVSAGGIADILLNPMFVVRTRLQTEALHQPAHRMSSIAAVAKELYRHGGLRIFWRGMTANLIGLSHVAVQFPVYEQLKSFLKRPEEPSINAVDLLLASVASKMAASLLTYPHEVIRSRMMDSRAIRAPLWGTCVRIFQKEGIRGFYAGLPVSLVRVIPSTAITFCVYELSVQFLRKHWHDENGQNAKHEKATKKA